VRVDLPIEVGEGGSETVEFLHTIVALEL